MNVSFATYAAHKKDLLSNYLLANSIRDFAGPLSGFPLRIYVSADLDAQKEMSLFSGLNVLFSPFPSGKRKYRYGFKSAAARACETDVKTGTVIWLDRHMLVLGPCTELLLNPSEPFAYRPPHLKILGASAAEPLNDLWATAYRIAGVDESTAFPLYTEVDRERIWSYFSAGHFSFRAEEGIMREWDTLFVELAEHPDMKPFLDEPVRVFLHQITLTIALLRKQRSDTLKPLPAFYGYPAHLHNEIEKGHQASQMDHVYTAFYSPHSNVPKKIVPSHLAAWLQEKTSQFHDYA